MKILFLVPPSKHSKNVARDLLYGCWCKGRRIGATQFPPISLLTVATLIRKEGNEIIFLDAAAENLSLKEVLKYSNTCAAVVLFSASVTINEDAQILRKLKKENPKLLTIVFGAQPTFMPQHTLTKKGIDIIIKGEPEFALKDLINALNKNDESWQQIKSIGYKHNGNIIINENYPLIKNLDLIPIADRTLLPKNLDYFNPIVKRVPYTTMFTSRGCPGKCIYCSSPAFYGNKIRFQSAARVLEEMKEVQKLGYKEVFFRDEIFTVSKLRTKQICEGILKNNINLSWICSARVGSVDEEMIVAMKNAGCHMLRFGVESGSQKILNNIKKEITVEQIKQTFYWTHKHKIDTHAHLMIGNPGETNSTIKETLKLLLEIEPTTITMGICTPYPGTILFNKIAKMFPEIQDGSQCDLSNLHTQGFYNDTFCKIPSEKLEKKLRYIYKKFYIRLKYIFKWLTKIKNIDELRRVTLAGTTVFDFVFRGE